MPYVTKKIRSLTLNYSNESIGPELINGILKLKETHNIPEITILLNSRTNESVKEVNNYLIYRHLIGKQNSSFEARGLRLYFDFLEAINKNWIDGDEQVFNRPISMFSKYLKDTFEKGEISGTVARNYFDSVVRFYQYHLEKGQKFNGNPITFKKKKLIINTNSLLNHISNYQIEIDVADCSPRIPMSAKSSELKPIKKEHLQKLFAALKEYSTQEFFLICFIAQVTGLRASEIADLKLDQFMNYNDEEIFNLYVGPQVGHKTKGNTNGVIKINRKVMELIQDYTTSSEYIKRLSKFKGDKPYLLLNRKGNAYSQQIISVMFNQLINKHLKNNNDFNYKFHDLRVTFGVTIMKACLNAKMTRSDALAYTQRQMRHKSLEMTLRYMEYWTHSVVNEQKSKIQDDILTSVFSEIGGIF